MIMQLGFCQAVAFERCAETRVGSGKPILPDLIEHGRGLRIRSATVTLECDFIADDGLIDQVIGSPFTRCGGEIERLIVQELGEPEFVFDITELDRVLADYDGDAIEDDGARKARGYSEEEHPELRHQNVCPIEKKNWK
jgi:hypothetical protein